MQVEIYIFHSLREKVNKYKLKLNKSWMGLYGYINNSQSLKHKFNIMRHLTY